MSYHRQYVNKFTFLSFGPAFPCNCHVRVPFNFFLLSTGGCMGEGADSHCSETKKKREGEEDTCVDISCQ